MINSFPGYEFVYLESDKQFHNMYRDTDIGKGGYIISNPGIYSDVALLDIQSLHPNSIRAMNCFGEYTKNFTDLLDARVAIKHKDFDSARKILNGKLAPYLDDESKAKELSQALKIAINSVYGLSAASFDNPFRDSRNKNNIVALRGALFMRTLQDEVESRGYKIVAIKTDSIKIANANKEIVDFCVEFAKQYGYTFEFEASYAVICQINDADYVARYATRERCQELYSRIPDDNEKKAGEWTATGKQFQIPYTFKTLFSKKPIEFADLCETKEVKSALYLDMNEGLPEGEHEYVFIGKVSNFCPVKAGCGGGELVRESTDKEGNKKYDSVQGAKGYRWKEAEVIKTMNLEDEIDRDYYRTLVDKAVEAISKYGDFEWFVSNDTTVKKPNLAECHDCPTHQDSLPWMLPCGTHSYETCFDCPHFNNDMFDIDCGQGYDISNVIISTQK